MTNLQSLIEQYQPTEAVRQLVCDTRIVLLVGISGAGKDTTKQRLMQSSEFADIVSYTTRQPRQNKGIWEREGIDYNYIDEATAARLLESHAFVEAKFVHGTVYGTGVKQIQDIHDADRVAVTDIDVQGVDEYKKLLKRFDEYYNKLEQKIADKEQQIAELTKLLEVLN